MCVCVEVLSEAGGQGMTGMLQSSPRGVVEDFHGNTLTIDLEGGSGPAHLADMLRDCHHDMKNNDQHSHQRPSTMVTQHLLITNTFSIE